MELFETNSQSPNLLPYDGTVLYYGKILENTSADLAMAQLLKNIDWQHDRAVIYGKEIITKRKVAWYGDQPFEYTYSGVTRRALLWTPELFRLKARIEATTGERYNSCLLNLYHSGEEGMAWHSDAERDLRLNGSIASLSLGATRQFAFKHKRTAGKVHVILEHGSLLEMKGTTQTHWLHSLPKTKKVHTPRINLTFRQIVQ